MPDRKRLEFLPQQHTDFIFRVESDNRAVQFFVRLLTPIARLFFSFWFWLENRRSKRRRDT
jgi:cell division protein FtsW (lipid II flippase)